MLLFRDRYDAGLALAERLRWTVAADPFTLVVALAKGGVVVAAALSEQLKAEVDLIPAHELELPGRQGCSVGVMVSGGLTLKEDTCQYLNVSDSLLDKLTSKASEEISRDERVYRGGRPPLPVKGRTVIVTDDGSSSSLAVVAAAKSLKAQGVKRTVVALPMASQSDVLDFGAHADDFVCIALPPTIGSPGMWFERYPPVTDGDIIKVLERTVYETKAAAAGTY